MKKQNIILTGFMGSGKSTVGRLLAEQLNLNFVDSDALIVTRDGRTIDDIFAQDGEPAFREWETKISRELAAQRGLVIATGGRLMLDEANATALSATGPVFCLTAEPEEIMQRLANDDVRRPLLEGANPAQRIKQLLSERAAGYGRFMQINTTGRPATAVAAEIAFLCDKDILPVMHPNGRYNVIIGYNLLPHLRQLAHIDGTVAIITDSNVGPLHAATCDPAAAVLTVPAGEENKTLETVNSLYGQLLAAGLDRQSTIVALGGGVTGDMGGFAAATYMRGVDLVQCPTSLLAMVDASVGGKTGVDLPQGKNLVGAFKQPTVVLADLDTLQTLPPLEFAAGMAEIVKHGLIADPDLFDRLATGDWQQRPDNKHLQDNLQKLVTDAVKVKWAIVQEDPFEHGRRAHLNLGHTFGHAIEQVSGYAVRHGEGVAMGLVAAAHMSAALGHCDASLTAQIINVLHNVGLPTQIPATLPAEAIYQAMFSDKKKAGGRLRFVLLHSIGETFVTSAVPKDAVITTLNACK